MNIRRGHKRFSAEVGASSMSDIMFFLMLFFLIVSTMVNPSVIKLMLPKASSAQSVSKQQFFIDISSNKEIYLNNKAITFPELEPALSTLLEGIEEPTVVLRVDNSLTIQDLVDILSVGNKLRVKMVLATKSPKAA